MSKSDGLSQVAVNEADVNDGDWIKVDCTFFLSASMLRDAKSEAVITMLGKRAYSKALKELE